MTKDAPEPETSEWLHNFGDLDPIPEGAVALCGAVSKSDGHGEDEPILHECCPICVALTNQREES